jgi:hypothetical protein
MLWAVLDNGERLQWPFAPLECVGPLRFGMTQAQVQAAVDGVLKRSVTHGSPGRVLSVYFALAPVDRPGRPVTALRAVTVYYDGSAGLACVAVDALCGPQVTLGGLRLTGQVPSRLEGQFAEYVRAQGRELWYGQEANPYSPELGLVLRVQRAGDVVLSRPVLVGAQWADRCGDVEGSIPQREWQTF